MTEFPRGVVLRCFGVGSERDRNATCWRGCRQGGCDGDWWCGLAQCLALSRSKSVTSGQGAMDSVSIASLEHREAIPFLFLSYAAFFVCSSAVAPVSQPQSLVFCTGPARPLLRNQATPSYQMRNWGSERGSWLLSVTVSG